MKTRTVLRVGAFGGALLLPLSAMAGQGFYWGLEGGASWLQKNNLNFNDSAIPAYVGAPGLTADYGTGWLGGVVVGYAAPHGLRPELELAYRRNDFNSLSANGVSVPASGNENAFTGMLNLWYDFNTGSNSRIHPYIGGGVGVAHINIDSLAAYENYFGQTYSAQLINDSNTVFAYQGGAGVGFDVTPGFTISLDYRYFDTNRGNYDLTSQPGLAGGLENSVSSGYRQNVGMVTFRFTPGSHAN